MYCTCAPCGDASMELCMAAQEDPTPWELPPAPAPATTLASASTNTANTADAPTQDALIGRAHFQLLGVVRRKPARTDAESTRSKSCSDKLALRQVSSLLCHETSLLIAPTANVYLAGVILPEEEISRVACDRAFGTGGRMEALCGRGWPVTTHREEDGSGYGYRFQPFRILSIPSGQIDRLYPFRKPSPCPSDDKPSKQITKPGNVSAIWTIAPSHASPLPDHNPKSLPKLRGSNTGLYETVINGVKQGNRASAPLARGASALCRARLWGVVRDVVGVDSCEEHDLWKGVLGASAYDGFKGVPEYVGGAVKARGQAIRDAREVLKGWVPNAGDEEWGLDVLIDPKKQKRSH